jgi:hypothetical protein
VLVEPLPNCGDVADTGTGGGGLTVVPVVAVVGLLVLGCIVLPTGVFVEDGYVGTVGLVNRRSLPGMVVVVERGYAFDVLFGYVGVVELREKLFGVPRPDEFM